MVAFEPQDGMTSLAPPMDPPVRTPGRIRVALVEDDPLQASELSRLLRSDRRLEWVGTWDSAETAAESLIRVAPAVVLVDIGLPGQSGIDLVREYKRHLSATQFMMLTVYDDTDRIFDALAAGATGYLLKKTAPAHLLNAIQELHDGGSPMSGPIARKVVSQFQQAAGLPDRAPPGNAHLAPREQEVLELLARGRLYKEIADELQIGLGTVRTHVRRIYKNSTPATAPRRCGERGRLDL